MTTVVSNPTALTLSSLQQTILSSILSLNQNAIIQGPVASGKTLIALHIAASCATTSNLSSVLFLAISPISCVKAEQWLDKHIDPLIRNRVHVHTTLTLLDTYFQTHTSLDGSVVHKQHTTIPAYHTVIIDDIHYLKKPQYHFITTALFTLSISPRLVILGDPLFLLSVTETSGSPQEDYLLEADFYFFQQEEGHRRLCTDNGVSNYRLQGSFSLSPEVSQWMNRDLRPDQVLRRGCGAWERNCARIGNWWAAGLQSAGTGEASLKEIDENQRKLNDPEKDPAVDTIKEILESYEQDRIGIVPIGKTKNVLDVVGKLKHLPVMDAENLPKAERDVVVVVGLDALYTDGMDKEEIVHRLNLCYIAAMNAKKLLIVVKFGRLQVPSSPVIKKAKSTVFEYKDLTEEQRLVVDTIAKKGRNVAVNAVAGSGKTRTALTSAVEWLKGENNDGAVLLVAYNKRLQEDMLCQRDSSVPMDSQYLIEVRTIHGLGHSYFGGKGLTTDKELTVWTQQRASLKRPLPPFNLVIIDEAQDITPTLFDFLHYFISLFENKPQLLILGDPFQLLYRYKDAKEEYLLEADKMFGGIVKDTPFDLLKLSICFRITHEMAAWINKNLNPNNLNRVREHRYGWFDSVKEQIAAWWGNGIQANPDRPPAPHSVEYFQRNRYKGKMLAVTLEKIMEIFSEYDTDSSALLSPSIVTNDNSPVRIITNKMKTINGNKQSWYHDCTIQKTDSDSPDIRQNKRIASTIHRFKGREKDAIVLVGMDSFAEKIEKEDPRNVFNVFYVGATRAREKLLIIEWDELAYATHSSRKTKLKSDVYSPTTCPVTKVIEHCPFDAVLCQESEECLTTRTELKIEAAPLSRDDYVVKGSHYGVQQYTLENVSSVIGVALEVKLQLLLDHGKLHVPELSKEETKGFPHSLVKFITRISEQAKTRSEYSWSQILEIATALLTITDRFYHRWRQVQDFSSWPVAMEPVKLDALVENLVRLIYQPFCCSSEFKDNVDMIPLHSKLEALQLLKRQGRLRLQQGVEFDMAHNKNFVVKHGLRIEGTMDIMLLPPSNIEQNNSDCSQSTSCGSASCDNSVIKETREDIGKPIIVEVKATTRATDNHRLQVACYGAMWREEQINKVDRVNCNYSQGAYRCQSHSKTNKKENIQKARYTNSLNNSLQTPTMYVVYPNLGQLQRVSMHMNSFEYLHRVGCRKAHQPFDIKMLKGENVKEGCDEPSPNRSKSKRRRISSS